MSLSALFGHLRSLQSQIQKDGLEMPTFHLSQNTWMSLKQTIGKGAKAGYSLGRNLQGINKAVLMTPKHDRHGLGYQPSNRGRNGRMER